MPDTQYFTGIDVVANGNTILSSDVKDGEARADLAELSAYVNGLTPIRLDVAQNGTYTAPTGLFGYNPVAVNIPGVIFGGRIVDELYVYEVI